ATFSNVPEAGAPLWTHDASVEPPVIAAAAAHAFVRELYCHSFVDIDSQAGLVVRVHVTAPDFGRAGKDFARSVGKYVLLLDSEVVAGQIQVHVHSVSDRRNIARPMPGRADVEKLAARRDLPRHVQAARCGDVDADEIDEPLGHQENPLVPVYEKLPHGDRATGLRS